MKTRYNKPKFVILGKHAGTSLPEAAVLSSSDVILSRDTIKIPLVKTLRKIHTIWNLNSKIELPLHCIWYKSLLDESAINPDEKVYFLVNEFYPLAYSRNYLNHLKMKFKNSRFIFWFVNSIAETKCMLDDKWTALKDFYDAGITFNKSDAAKLGLLHCDYWPCVFPELEFEPENQSDVCFIGTAKDRLKKILAVYEKLKDAGLKCDFRISGVPENQQKYADEIKYLKRWIPYREILQCEKNTKCILEILPFGQNYSSLRVNESLWYHKKLLTTNIEAPSEWFYNPEIVHVFSDAGDIDTNFISRPLSPEDEHRIYDNMNIGDWNIFADFIIKNVP